MQAKQIRRVGPSASSQCSRIIAGIAILFLVGSTPSLAANWADQMFETRSHDFRMVGRGAKSQFHFQFTNNYQRDVHIASVRTSCGCTTPIVTKKTVRTHESGEIIASLNTETFVGQKAATVTVVFDRPSYAEVKLNVSGFIRTDITFDPPEMNFGEIQSGEQPEREVTVTHIGDPKWEINDVRSHCQELKVRLLSVERASRKVQYRLSVRLDGQLPEGDLRERITLISNDAKFPTTEMMLFGRVRPTVSVSPAAVSLGDTPANGKKEQRLIVRADEPFEVLNVLCGDSRLEFEVASGQKKVHFINMRFRGNGSQDSISEAIQVITNLSEQKTASCVVTGRISK